LRPGGYLCFVDSRHRDEIQTMRNFLVSSGLKMISDIDISSNVAKALDLFAPLIPKLLDNNSVKTKTGKRIAYEQLLTDLPNRWYPHFSGGKYVYLSCTLQKPLKSLM